ncbi:DUF7146 domain-containing protein [Paracraurococcus ruber]|uniref:Toprim domain-containing protein n=1 Tax=Paracraurococcus ruber TaxID=77675 RepID=A0ABS1CV12_9PROT|nr:toprim domain-containing protein [Paracraurococcus ruber]MBK1658240.1 hypothetical protein [Paracraurococcus ruber]TDG30611.1 virulence-associated protein E [Paracraurococcus ruber]
MIGARDLAARLGLRAVRQRSEWRGDCPSCGYGASLAVKEKDGRALWWCAACQDGEAVRVALWRALGRGGTPPSTQRHTDNTTPPAARKTALARALWDRALPPPGTIAERYLAARGLPAVRSDELRYLPDAPHPSGKRLPAMLAAIRNPLSGDLQAVHRTYLRPDGSGKAAEEPAKASLGPVAGGVVMLAEPREGEPLVIGEGIETALSAAVLIGGAAWSAVSAGNLAALRLPAVTLAPLVVIAADPDPPGQHAAHAAARRWRVEGRSVRIATPDIPGFDFNDLLCARNAAQETHHAP